MRNTFTDKELKAIKKNLTIVIDTREQRNEHITEFFRRNNINYKIKKLDFGDYSCMLPIGTLEGQTRDIYFDRDFVIERKNSIDELAGNFKDDGVRIKSELANIKGLGVKVYLYLEDPDYFINLRQGNYRSEYKPVSLYARIKKSLEMRYNIPVIPVGKNVIGSEIYESFQAFVYEKFKHEGYILEE